MGPHVHMDQITEDGATDLRHLLHSGRRSRSSVQGQRGANSSLTAIQLLARKKLKGGWIALRKRYYDATHHLLCMASRPEREAFGRSTTREPSSTAGQPILRQMLSREVTDALIVVVRYFGGTKLGVPGLIEAYKRSAALVLEECRNRTAHGGRTDNDPVQLSSHERCDAHRQGIAAADYRTTIRQASAMTLAIRQGFAAQLLDRLSKVEGLELETDDQ
ncbi:MAG: YigZ family protein [Alistipes indistinctus]